MLYYLPDIAKEYLLNLYNHIYQYGVIPSQWRNIQIVPIPKSSSNNSSEVKLRPISLISCICKTFHLMIYKRLEWYTEKETILSPFTLGFRKSKSCLDCLTQIVTSI